MLDNTNSVDCSQSLLYSMDTLEQEYWVDFHSLLEDLRPGDEAPRSPAALKPGSSLTPVQRLSPQKEAEMMDMELKDQLLCI